MKDGFACQTDAARLGDGEWHHAAFVFDGGRMRHFLDGRAQPEPAAKAAPAETPGEIPGLIGVISRAAIENGVVRRLEAVNVKVMGPIDSYWGETYDLAWVERWWGRLAPGSLPGHDREPLEFFAECAGGARLAIHGQAVIDGLSNAAARQGQTRRWCRARR